MWHGNHSINNIVPQDSAINGACNPTVGCLCYNVLNTIQFLSEYISGTATCLRHYTNILNRYHGALQGDA